MNVNMRPLEAPTGGSS